MVKWDRRRGYDEGEEVKEQTKTLGQGFARVLKCSSLKYRETVKTMKISEQKTNELC